MADRGIRFYNVQPGFIATERMAHDMGAFDLRVRWSSVDSTRERVSADGVLRFLRGEAAGSLARSKVRAGLGEFVRAIGNVVRRGAKMARG
jgi:NAD(P)-dependent dehydrogenase (short-subunit alcohol dehydrogenase family)